MVGRRWDRTGEREREREIGRRRKEREGGEKGKVS